MISSTTNAKVKYVRRLQADRRFRSREQAFVVEGTRWFSELPPHTALVRTIYYTPEWGQAPGKAALLARVAAPQEVVSPAVMGAMSATETAAGILAVVAYRPLPLPPQPSLLLILDAVRDPGNLGTLLRTAAAAGAEGVLLAPGCVDAANPKAVRASMGALLRLPVLALGWDAIAQAAASLHVWLADAAGEVEYTAVDWRPPAALIVGGEAHGAGSAAARVASGRLAIPMHAQTESLNAAMAAGIILFEAARQRRAG